MKLSLWINKVVIEKLSYSLPVAINAVAGITDYQPNQIRSVNFLSWKAHNACIDSLWSSYQMKSLLKACWNEQVKNLLELNALNIKCRVFPLTWSMSMIFNLSIRIEFNSRRISWEHQHGRRDVTWKHFMQNLQHIPYLWSAPSSRLFGSCSGGGKKEQQCLNCCTST